MTRCAIRSEGNPRRQKKHQNKHRQIPPEDQASWMKEHAGYDPKRQSGKRYVPRDQPRRALFENPVLETESLKPATESALQKQVSETATRKPGIENRFLKQLSENHNREFFLRVRRPTQVSLSSFATIPESSLPPSFSPRTLPQ